MALTPDPWHLQAACKGMACDLFFENQRNAAAKAACARCPVQVDCLNDALAFDHGDDFGVWGGTTRPEREAIRRQRPALRLVSA